MDRPAVNDQTDRFLQDVAAIRLKAAGRDALLLKLGAAMMPLGVVLSVVGWFLSRNSQTSLDQNDALIVAVIGVAVAVVGVGLFLRYSLAEFLRFWLARMIHQQDLANQSLVEATRRPVTAPATEKSEKSDKSGKSAANAASRSTEPDRS